MILTNENFNSYFNSENEVFKYLVKNVTEYHSTNDYVNCSCLDSDCCHKIEVNPHDKTVGSIVHMRMFDNSWREDQINCFLIYCPNTRTHVDAFSPEGLKEVVKHQLLKNRLEDR